MTLLACCFFVTGSLCAQTWQEWFHQKKTQKLYLIQQIAALKVYLGYAKRGYNIAGKGINAIRDIKKGDFDIHRNFLEALKLVNPKFGKYAKVTSIINYHARIIQLCAQFMSKIRTTEQFSPTETDYCKRVFDNLLNECIKNMEHLLMITSSGNLEMKDDERLRRINSIHADMQDKYAFCSAFGNELVLLNAQRLTEKIEINHSKIINGLR